MLPHQARLTFYNSLVLPLFDYGGVVWGNENSSILMEILTILQNKAAKIILSRYPYLRHIMFLIILAGSHSISGAVFINAQCLSV